MKEANSRLTMSKHCRLEITKAEGVAKMLVDWTITKAQ